MIHGGSYQCTLILLLVLSGCGGTTNTGLDDTPTTVGSAAVTVSGTTVIVVDSASGRLTPEEEEEVRKVCSQAAPMPGPGGCEQLLRELALRIYREGEGRPGCTPGYPCFKIALAADSTVGVVRVQDPRPGSPLCAGGRPELCGGVLIPADLVTPTVKNSATTPVTLPTKPSVTTGKKTTPVTTSTGPSK